jgi:hypothetical protein
VAKRWDHVKVPGHVPMVLEAAKRLHSGERLFDMDGKPVPLPRSKVAKKTRTSDSDPPYSPIRGPGNKSTRGPNRGRGPQALRTDQPLRGNRQRRV